MLRDPRRARMVPGRIFPGPPGFTVAGPSVTRTLSRMRVRIAVAALLALGPANAASAQHATMDLDFAMREAAAAQDFQSAAVGYAGVRPRSVTAWRVIRGAPDAVDRFSRLLDASSPAAQLYALAGLQAADAKAFRRALPRFAGRTDQVRVVRGCEVSTEPFDQLVREIEQGIWARELHPLPGRQEIPEPIDNPIASTE